MLDIRIDNITKNMLLLLTTWSDVKRYFPSCLPSLISFKAPRTSFTVIEESLRLSAVTPLLIVRYKECSSTGPVGVGETGASCYGGRLLQGRFMQNYNTDG